MKTTPTDKPVIPHNDLREAQCPRCGYDQRGVTAAWTDSCPLTGLCSECGLEFVWCEVLQPEKFEPRWCVEFEPKPRRIPLAALRTFMRSLWPWGFWRRLKMSDAIRWRRLIVYLLLMMVPLLIAYVGIQGVAASQVRSRTQGMLAGSTQQRAASILQLQGFVQRAANIVPSADANAAMAIQGQVTRANAQIAQLQALGTTPDTIDAPWMTTTWEAISQPWSRVSSANIVTGAARIAPYPSPSDVLESWLPFNPSQWGWWSGGMLDRTVTLAWVAWGVAMTALLPLSFLLMPFSLRKAKVRWGHIVRVTIYSVWIPVTGMSVIMAAFAIDAMRNGSAYPQDGWWTVLARYGPWIAVALWWHAAVGRYLKIPQAWLTVGLLTLMCLLILLGVTAAINYRLAWEMLDFFEPLIP